MEFLVNIFTIIAITLLALMSGVLIKKVNTRPYFLPAAWFCFAVASYLVVTMGLINGILYYVFHIPVFSVSFAFWIFSKSIFDDNFKLEKWMGWLLLFVLSTLFINLILREQVNSNHNLFKLSLLIHHIPTLLFTFLAIAEAWRNKEADLLVDRLQFRKVFIFITGAIITIVVLVEMAFVPNIPIAIIAIQRIVIVILTFYFALSQLNINESFFNEPSKPIPSPTIIKTEIDKKMINQLLDLIEEQKYYRTEGLTISALADKMGVKEYKLRKAINQQLGFRNFNDFLNSYRIQEACDHLIDPTKKEFTVLEIAYEIGYNSLAPFNKAFKQQTGMTPTGFKQQPTSVKKN